MDFYSRFKDYNPVQLFRILEEQDKYQAEAIQAAVQLLAEKQLSEEERTTAISFAQSQIEEEKKRDLNQSILQEKLTMGGKALEELTPIRMGNANPAEKKILIVSLVYLLVWVLGVVSYYDLISLMIQGEPFGRDRISMSIITIVTFLLPSLYLGITLVLFYLKKRPGWILFAIYFTYLLVGDLSGFIYALVTDNAVSNFYGLIDLPRVVIKFIDMGIHAGTLYIVAGEDVREEYNISKKTMTTIIGIMAAIAVAFVVVSFVLVTIR